MKKKKSKVAEFFGTIGMGLAFVWMLPVLAVEGLQEHFEKKRKAEQPKPEPIQFVCSECSETFEADNVKKEVRNHASSNGDYSYSKPQPWATFISHLSINWGYNDNPIDEGQQEFKCTQCGATFSAIDIRPHPYSASFPSRCPHCQSIRTLPTSEEKRASRYEGIWLLMELTEKERKEDKKEAIFEKFAANW